jgi:hypothetical protein
MDFRKRPVELSQTKEQEVFSQMMSIAFDADAMTGVFFGEGLRKGLLLERLVTIKHYDKHRR